MKTVCDYYGCNNTVRQDDIECQKDGRYTPRTQVYCDFHGLKFDELIKDNNVPGMLSFWVKAGGGAERMVKGS